VMMLEVVDPVPLPGDLVGSNSISETTSKVSAFGSGGSEADRRDIWFATFERFSRVHSPQHAASLPCDDSQTGSFYALLQAGDRPGAYLDEIRKRLGPLERSLNGSLRIGDEDLNESLIEQVSLMARPYHIEIWGNCSKEERIALFDLAADGLMNPRNPELKPLIRRGLIVRAPAPGLMDESFRRFVLAQAQEEGFITCVRDYRTNPWQNWRLLALLMFIALTAFLLLTQREMYQSTVTFVSTLSGGAFTFFNLLDIFWKGKIIGPTPSSL